MSIPRTITIPGFSLESDDEDTTEEVEYNSFDTDVHFSSFSPGLPPIPQNLEDLPDDDLRDVFKIQETKRGRL